MGIEQCTDHRAESIGVELRRGVDDERLIEPVDRATDLTESLDDRQERNGCRPGGRCVVAVRRSGRNGVVDPLGDRAQSGDGAVGEDIPRRESDTTSPCTIDQGRRDDAVAAESEEVVVDARRVGESEGVGEDVGERGLDLGRRCTTLRGADLRLRKCCGIGLSVDGQRDRVDDQHGRRDLVLGECVAQRCVERFSVQGFRSDVVPDGVGQDSVGTARSGPGQDGGVAHTGQSCECGPDLPEFDTETTDLDLRVRATDIDQRALSGLTEQIARAIEHLTGARGVGDETRRMQRRTLQVAGCDLGACEVQLAHGANGYPAQVSVEQVAGETW